MPASPPALLVHDYVSGGGWPGPALPAALASEALAIVRAVLADLREWGELSVVTTRDRRLSGVGLDADRVVDVDAQVYPTPVRELARACGAALLVAPEGGGVAARTAALFAGDGVRLVGSPPDAIAAVADKWACWLRWRAAGLPTPRTELVPVEEAWTAAARIGYPVVVKPRSGAACRGVSLAAAPEDLAGALREVLVLGETSVLVQEYATGTPASVSLVVSSDGARVLSLNEQRVTSGTPFTYRGGIASVAHARRDEAFAVALRAVGLEPRLRGYVGVDLVLAEDGCRLLEINPRLTTSYVGLRRVSETNVARAVWEACLEDRLPDEAPYPPSASFTLEEGHGS
jgi:predicted ATP-grasp superfamily ATP-dependent carboligase